MLGDFEQNLVAEASGAELLSCCAVSVDASLPQARPPLLWEPVGIQLLFAPLDVFLLNSSAFVVALKYWSVPPAFML